MRERQVEPQYMELFIYFLILWLMSRWVAVQMISELFKVLAIQVLPPVLLGRKPSSQAAPARHAVQHCEKGQAKILLNRTVCLLEVCPRNCNICNVMDETNLLIVSWEIYMPNSH